MPSDRGNGIFTEKRHLDESTGVYRIRRRKSIAKRAGLWSLVAALLGGGGFGVTKLIDARAAAVAIAKLEVESASHAKQFEKVNAILEKHSDRLEDIAIWMGVPRDYRKAPNLGVAPMSAAVHPKPKPREPQ